MDAGDRDFASRSGALPVVIGRPCLKVVGLWVSPFGRLREGPDDNGIIRLMPDGMKIAIKETKLPPKRCLNTGTVAP